MAYALECLDNGGFEDQLSPNRIYKVLEFGTNSVLIENDLSQERWYGEAHFGQPGYQD